MPRLSKKLVDELQPRTKDYFIWDDQVKGFGVRVKSLGTRSYIVQYRTRRGKARRFTIGKHGTVSAKDARKRALQQRYGKSLPELIRAALWIWNCPRNY